MKSNPIARLRFIGFYEAISFLLLVFVAMPMKYVGEIVEPVRYLGWAHGVLFMAYCWYLMQSMMAAGWPLRRGAILMIAALFPFGPFLTHKGLVVAEEEFLAKND